MAKKLTRENLTECGLDRSTSERLVRAHQFITHIASSGSLLGENFSQTILTPDHPFALHQLLHKTVFADWDGCGCPRLVSS